MVCIALISVTTTNKEKKHLFLFLFLFFLERKEGKQSFVALETRKRLSFSAFGIYRDQNSATERQEAAKMSYSHNT